MRNIDDQINLMSQHQVQKIRRFLLQLADCDGLYACCIQSLGSSLCGKDLIADIGKSSGNGDHLFLILIPYSDNHVLIFGKLDARALECLVKGLIKGFCNTQALAGGLHLRPQVNVCTADLLKGEYRHLDGIIICLRLQTGGIAQLADGMAADDLGGQRYNGDSRYLADIGHSTGGPGIYLDNVYILSVHDKLDVDHALYVKSPRQLLGVGNDGLYISFGNIVSRIYGDGVAGVNAGSLNMLHDSRNQNILAVADGIHLQLLAHDVLIHQDGMLLGNLIDDADELVNVLIVDGNLHALAA